MAGVTERPLYPLGEHAADSLRARSGRALGDLTVDACAAGSLRVDDIAIDAETLRRQAGVARAAGRPQLGENLERAAEMVTMPAALIFEIYEKLRPGRAADRAELQAIADDLRRNRGAERLARLVEDAAAAYEARGLFRQRFG